MFLIERFFGVACYFIALLFVFAVIYYKKVRVKHALIFYLLVLTVFAYFYEPHTTADLYRILRIVDSFKSYRFLDFIKLKMADDTTPMAYLLYWMISRLGNPKLLPAVVVAITYSITFYIILKSSKIYKIENESIAIVLLFVMSTGNYMMVISNIRTMLAISLLCFCFYRESVLGTFRIWHIPLYLFAALTHNLAIILIIIRCIAFIFSSHLKGKAKFFISLVIGALLVYFMINLDWMAEQIFDKAVAYISGDAYSYIWEYVIGFIAILIELSALMFSRRFLDKGFGESRLYLLLCVITSLIFIREFSIFHRLVTYIAPILTIPVLSVCFTDGESIKKKRNFVFCLSLFMLAVACFRGSLSSIKFFVL